MAGKRADWTPITHSPGFMARVTVAMPETSPPPPTATTSVSRSGWARSISRPMVPCPAITSGSSKGCTKASPCSSARRIAWSRASSKPSPWSSTSAPKPRVRSTLTAGVASGITITARRPRRWAWWATPCAWLPAEAAITPLSGVPASRAATSASNLLSAPRSLKEAVNCRFSNFRKTCAPVICDSVFDSTQGVSST
jgi:hypothetical protein